MEINQSSYDGDPSIHLRWRSRNQNKDGDQSINLRWRSINQITTEISQPTYDGDGVVDVAVGEEVGAQALLLDLPRQHLAHTVRIVEQVPHLVHNKSLLQIRDPVPFLTSGSGIRDPELVFPGSRT